MRVLLTSAGLETEIIQKYFVKMLEKDVSKVRALFIPTAAIDAGAIKVLPKCMNDLLKCGIDNINVFDLHTGMEISELQKYDVVYLCGGNPSYLLERVNATGFGESLMEYIEGNGLVIGVSAGSLIFSNNLVDNLGLIDTALYVHCQDGETIGKIDYPLKDHIKLTNICAIAIREISNGIEIIGE